MLIALLLAIFPACPSDGITADEPPICVWDASSVGTEDNGYFTGLDFVAFNGEAGNYIVSIPSEKN